MSISKIEGDELRKIINPILQKYDLRDKEKLEVCQVAKFIHNIGVDIQIIDKPQPPAPDFLLRFNLKTIALEHTRILTENAQKYLKVKSLVDYAQKVYSEKYADSKILADITFKNDSLEYKQNQKKELANIIADFVYNYQSDNNIETPDFITRIRTTKHSKATLNLMERNWEAPILERERLKCAIHRKELKINEYHKSKIDFSEIWLILLIGSLNSASYSLNKNENYKMSSKFDRVYLKTDFDDDIIRIK